MERPVILITHRHFMPETPWGVGGLYRAPVNYCRAIVNAGGVPVISALGDAAVYADRFDGILFTGASCDVNPVLYQETVRGAKEIDEDLDEMELRLFREFSARKKPIMGVCRGAQLINVALGGKLYQDIVDEGPPCPVHQGMREKTHAKEHNIHAEPGSVLNNLFGETFLTNSYHHQAIKECGVGLVPTGISEDGVIEAIEHKKLPIIGVQWHPERMIGEEFTHRTNMLPLWEYFVNQCRNHK